RWNPTDVVVVDMGVDEGGQSLVRRELCDAGVAFFPLTGNPVPPAAFVKNEVVTSANTNRFYLE
ncbi:MAG TPA: hypothetical protein VMU36_14050, partial [Spirochaetia bacterium]|nr:hypothetical protein [Spirochaetia bacterium]